MAKGIDVQITAGGGGTPQTYSLERQIDGGGYSVVDGSIAYTASPQTYADTNGGAGFSDGAVVDYRATATNTDGTSDPSTVEQIIISASGASPNVSTATFDTSFDASTQDTQIMSIDWNNDGTIFYIMGAGSSDKIHSYSVSIAYDIGSTVTFLSSTGTKPSNWGSFPTQIRFSPNGLKAFVSTFTNKTIIEYTLSTAYDLADIISANEANIFTSTATNMILGFTFNADGTKIIYGDSSANGSIYEVTLGTAYSLGGTVTEGTSIDVTVTNTGARPNGVAMSSDQTKLYVACNNASPTIEDIVTYDLSANNGSLVGAIYQNPEEKLSVNPQIDVLRGIYMKSDGSRFWVTDDSNGQVAQYDIP